MCVCVYVYLPVISSLVLCTVLYYYQRRNGKPAGSSPNYPHPSQLATIDIIIGVRHSSPSTKLQDSKSKVK